MIQENVQIGGRTAEGFVIPLGPVAIVAVVGERGMIGCGALDIAALQGFGYPAAKMRHPLRPIASIGDILEAVVREANPSASSLGVKEGMSGREALERL